MIGFTDAPPFVSYHGRKQFPGTGVCVKRQSGNPLELGCRELMYPRRDDTHQRSQALRLLEELAARAGENDQPAIENDRLGSEFEREARMLLDEQHGQPGLALPPGRAR